MEAVRLLGSLNSDTARLLELEPHIHCAEILHVLNLQYLLVASPQLSFKLRSRGSCARKQDIVRFQVQVTNQLRMPGLHSDPHGSTLLASGKSWNIWKCPVLKPRDKYFTAWRKTTGAKFHKFLKLGSRIGKSISIYSSIKGSTLAVASFRELKECWRYIRMVKHTVPAQIRVLTTGKLHILSWRHDELLVLISSCFYCDGADYWIKWVGARSRILLR